MTPSLRIAVLSPTTIQFVEKMASLFPGEPITVVGPPNADQWGWNNYERRAEEWRSLGLRIAFDLRPYDQIDFSGFDVLLETFETLHMEPTWREHCARYECPVVVKACWTREPHVSCPEDYYNKIKDIPVLLEMPAHIPLWEMAGFSDLTFLFNPVGDWWFDTPWTGATADGVMILSGKEQWRQSAFHGLDLFEGLQARFPGRIRLHDGMVQYKTSREMSYMLSGARVFLALDAPQGAGERPLSLAFSEALAAGCPVAARDLPGLNYKDFITSNGIATNDFDALCGFVGRCLDDLDFAKACSQESRRIAREAFSTERLQAEYLKVFARAKTAWLRRDEPETAPTVISAYARHYKE
jgi:hypothetical protein